MDTPFLSLVEARWNALLRSQGGLETRSSMSFGVDQALLIEIETRQAKAFITARERPRSIEILVRRIKSAEQIICEGNCPSDFDLERGLGAPCTELFTSPFES